MTQDTFVRAYGALDRFDGRSEPFTWIYRICVNLSLNALRSRKTRRASSPDDPRIEGLLVDNRPAGGSPQRSTADKQLGRALVEGIDASALERVYEERLQLSPGAARMLAGAKAAGLKTLLVSGGFTFFTEKLKARLGLDFTHANTLEIVDGKLTGRVTGEIVNADVKARTLRETCAQLGIEPKRAIAMGDGSNDLKMMAEAGLSVAFRAKPVVREAASVAFNFVGLDGLLRLF